MASERRFGPEDSDVRQRFVDAAEAILCAAGDHAVSARAVATRAGLKSQLLYYYFRSMDELLIAVVRRGNERRLVRFERALQAPDPLRAMWATLIDPDTASLGAAITSLASRNQVVREEIVESTRRFRLLQADAVARLAPATQDQRWSAGGLVLIAAALSRMLVNEQALGLTEGHAEARAMADRMLDDLSP